MNLYQARQNQLIQALNFIYGGSTNNTRLDVDVHRWIKQGGKNNTKLLNQLQVNEALTLNHWTAVYDKVKKDYDNYLNELNRVSTKDIEVLIIAEAPMLTVDSLGGLKANYIFSDCSVGSYRTVPYEAISSFYGSAMQNGYQYFADPLIELFKNNHVGFVDLVPIPLPQLSSNLRNAWNDQGQKFFLLHKRPHVVDMLENAVNHFLKVTQRKFSKDLKVIFMMPRNTATGILDYCAKLKDENFNSFLYHYKQSILQTTDGSNLKMVNNQNRDICKQMVNAKSGYPNLSRFEKALN